MRLTALHWRRLWIWVGSLCVLLLSIGLILDALKQNLNAYVTPTSLIAAPDAHASIRLGGLVAEQTLIFDQDNQVHFTVTDGSTHVAVVYDGVLPALFEEGKGVVVQGHYRTEKHRFEATQVLAKHDENYQPPLPI